jgi:hypothetical protein
MRDTWDNVTGAMEAELVPMLDLLVRKVDPRDVLGVDERRALEAATWLKHNLPRFVVAARCHSAGPILPGWATLQNTGERLGIPYRTVYRWATTGHGPGGIPIRAEYHGSWFVNIDDARRAAQHGHGDD